MSRLPDTVRETGMEHLKQYADGALTGTLTVTTFTNTYQSNQNLQGQSAVDEHYSGERNTGGYRDAHRREPETYFRCDGRRPAGCCVQSSFRYVRAVPDDVLRGSLKAMRLSGS